MAAFCLALCLFFSNTFTGAVYGQTGDGANALASGASDGVTTSNTIADNGDGTYTLTLSMTNGTGAPIYGAEIADVLSEYVELVDGSVVAYTCGSASGELSGAVDASSSATIRKSDSAAVLFNSTYSNRTIGVTSASAIEDGASMTIKLKVKPSDAANAYYEENGTYPNVGSEGSDSEGNSSSSRQPGFYADTAVYAMYYTTADKSGDQTKVTMAQHPVVQAAGAASYDSVDGIELKNQITDNGDGTYTIHLSVYNYSGYTLDGVEIVDYLSEYVDLVQSGTSVSSYDFSKFGSGTKTKDADSSATAKDATSNATSTTDLTDTTVDAEYVYEFPSFYNTSMAGFYNTSDKGMGLAINGSMKNGADIEYEFTVNPNAAASTYYAANGYPHTGTSDSDYGSNTTSSGKAGFFADRRAVMNFTVNGTVKTVILEETPVVQVDENVTSTPTVTPTTTAASTTAPTSEPTASPETTLTSAPTATSAPTVSPEDAPEHHKSIESEDPDDDGCYTLYLTAEGAETKGSETTVEEGTADIVIVLDYSYSMYSQRMGFSDYYGNGESDWYGCTQLNKVHAASCHFRK